MLIAFVGLLSLLLAPSAGLCAFFLILAVGRVFGSGVARGERPAQSDHHGDHIDIRSQEVEIAGHLAQLLTLAREILRRVDGVPALGHAAQAGGE